MQLEGLRGLAAIAVVFDHFAYVFYPFLLTGNAGLIHTKYESAIRGTPLGLLYAGTFAVAIFFVLSGFVLSVGFFQKKDDSLIKKLASRRYLRLMLPALAATLLAFVLMRLGPYPAINRAAEIAGSSFLEGVWILNSNIWDAVYSGSIGIFLHSGSMYNGVLWTMMIEFIGSFLVFAFLLFAARSRYRPVVYLALRIFTFNTWYMAFIIGVLIADLYVHGHLGKMKQRFYFVPPLLICAIVLGSYPHRSLDGTIYEYINIKSFNFNSEIFYLTIAASMLVVVSLSSSRMKAFLSHPVIAKFGQYTFSLYLVHLLVIYTLTTSLFVTIYPHFGYNISSVLSISISLPVIWAVTLLFERFIDAPSIRLAKYASDIYDGTKSIKPRSAIKLLKARARNYRIRGPIQVPESVESLPD